jgi:chromosome transmission fidelity protein 1
VDEAHNIIDAISNANAAAIKLSDLKRARQMLGIYVRRFGKKLKAENRANVARVGRVIEGLSEWMAEALKSNEDQGIADSNTLLKHKSIDQINMFELIKYIQISKLAYKIESYVSHVEEQATATGPASSSSPAVTQQSARSPTASTPALHALLSFLQALTNLSFEGRVFFQKLDRHQDMQLSYLLLSPTHAFSSIASKARAVILAGGTMSPFDDYTAHLFPDLPPSKITTLSCGHVIPRSNLCVWTLAKAKSSKGNDVTFEFNYQTRSDTQMMAQLGLVLLNMSTIVPDGMVVFFPSYNYLDAVTQIWQSKPSSSSEPSLWDRLSSKKALFAEQKGSSSTNALLDAYSAAILHPATSSSKGAILLSVLGGTLSEGINFADRLGRLVVVVGLPFPNRHSPEWKARSEYIHDTTVSRLSGTLGLPAARERAQRAAREFYENACMRAVNQGIGRAIRHRGDYAGIVLVDRRYGTDRIRKKLPGWIRDGLVGDSHEKGLPQLMAALGGFFRAKKV